jgi:hypothetical protein
MKKLAIYFLAPLFLLTSCEDFLTVNSYTSYDSSTFPKSEQDVIDLLTGVYSNLNRLLLQVNGESTYFMISELFSDDRFGGGGRNDINTQAYNHLLAAQRNHMANLWTWSYRGISRANVVLEELEKVEFERQETKDKLEGEARFLRAHFYFDLVRCLGNIPLMTTTPQDVEQAKQILPQADPDDVYRLIATDLWEAYRLLPETKWSAPSDGRATRWAAAGLLARAYLFYTGFYGKPDLPREGGTVTKQNVIVALEEVMQKSGHGLVNDFRTLWAYTNPISKPDYHYAKNLPDMIKDGHNKEHVFVIKCAPTSAWNANGTANVLCLSFGLRNQARDYRTVFPMGQGWGFGPVSSVLWDDWIEDEPNDMRRKASIWSPDEAINPTTWEIDKSYYDWGKENIMEETGFWQKKICSYKAFGKNGSNKLPANLWNSWESSPQAYNLPQDNNQHGYGTDLILIRYADILLMHSELTETVAGINEVRDRAGLPPRAAYNLEELQKERRYELAFEGIRWSDLRRWGGQGDRSVGDMLNRMYTKVIYNNGVELPMRVQGRAGDVKARYEATKGFMMIPQQEIDLSNGVVKQNPGWLDGDQPFFQMWI